MYVFPPSIGSASVFKMSKGNGMTFHDKSELVQYITCNGVLWVNK